MEEVCPRGCGALKWQSCGRGMEVGEEERLDRRYETPVGALGELLCVQVALWQVVVVCPPAERMETMREEVEEPGYVPCFHLLMCVFCEGSFASVAALELHPHLPVMGHSTCCQMSVACTVGEVEELRIHLLVVCWKTEGASWSWKGCGLCLELVGGASLCYEQ